MHERVSLARLLNFHRAALTTIWAFGQVDVHLPRITGVAVALTQVRAQAADR